MKMLCCSNKKVKYHWIWLLLQRNIYLFNTPKYNINIISYHLASCFALLFTNNMPFNFKQKCIIQELIFLEYKSLLFYLFIEVLLVHWFFLHWEFSSCTLIYHNIQRCNFCNCFTYFHFLGCNLSIILSNFVCTYIDNEQESCTDIFSSSIF